MSSANNKHSGLTFSKNLVAYASLVVIVVWIILIAWVDLPRLLSCGLGNCSDTGVTAYLSFIPLLFGSIGLGYGLERGENRTKAKRLFFTALYSFLLFLPIAYIGFAAAWSAATR